MDCEVWRLLRLWRTGDYGACGNCVLGYLSFNTFQILLKLPPPHQLLPTTHLPSIITTHYHLLSASITTYHHLEYLVIVNHMEIWGLMMLHRVPTWAPKNTLQQIDYNKKAIGLMAQLMKLCQQHL